MNTQRVIIGLVTLTALLALTVGLGQAQAPDPQRSLASQTSLDTSDSTLLSMSFTYQGQLKRASQLISDDCDLAFRLYDAANAGNQVGNPITTTVPISKGLFTVGLDFGASAFTGDARWLGIAVKCSGESAYTPLGRQAITAAPYAVYAANAPWGGLSGVPAGFADGVDDTGLTSITWTDILSRPSGLDDGDDNTTYTTGAGLVMTGTQLTVDYTAVAPLAHTHTFTCPDALKYFEEEWSIPTNGAYDWEFFTIGSDAYLAMANYYDGSTHNIDSKIYRWNGTVFSVTQSISTRGAFDWEFFTVGSDAYLAVANNHNDATPNIDSKIYRWNGTGFVEFQSIPTLGATDWEFFTIGSDAYLAVANNHNGSTYNNDSKIYRWNGTSFVEFQSIPTHGARDWQFFTIGSEAYLAMANNYNDSTWNIDSKIYRWNGASFVEFQSIPTNGAFDWEFFIIGSDAYLAMANQYNGTYNINSKIYRWDGTGFVEFQFIPTHGAADWEFFSIGSDAYLAIANQYDGSTYNIDSKIYRWNGTSFVESQSIPTHGAFDWEFFSISSNAYLAVANNDFTYTTGSKVYKAMLQGCCGTVGYPSALGGTYLQLDTLTVAPPAADCDQASERGRMKVDVANSRLYICTNSGWVTK